MSAGPLKRLRGHVVDSALLRESREFRLFWLGQSVSGTANRLTQVALAFQVYRLTGSSLAVGLLALVRIVPLLLCSLPGGAIADAVDRRKLLLWAQAGAVACTLALALNAVTTPRLWIIYALAAAAVVGSRALLSPGSGSIVAAVGGADREAARCARADERQQQRRVADRPGGRRGADRANRGGRRLLRRRGGVHGRARHARRDGARAARARDAAPRPRVDVGRSAVPQRPAGAPIDLCHRSQRDGVRHADVAVSGDRRAPGRRRAGPRLLLLCGAVRRRAACLRSRAAASPGCAVRDAW